MQVYTVSKGSVVDLDMQWMQKKSKRGRSDASREPRRAVTGLQNVRQEHVPHETLYSNAVNLSICIIEIGPHSILALTWLFHRSCLTIAQVTPVIEENVYEVRCINSRLRVGLEQGRFPRESGTWMQSPPFGDAFLVAATLISFWDLTEGVKSGRK